MTEHKNTYPKLHNAAWPGVVGKGSPDGDPVIGLDSMLDLTASAEFEGVKFDGFDLFLYEPHFNIDGTDDDIAELAEKAKDRNLTIGTVVAPIWPPTGGGSAMGDDEQIERFLGQVKKGCRVAMRLREMGIRPYGTVRVDTGTEVASWAKDPEESQKRLAKTLREACSIAEDHGEKLAAEGEICWGGIHSCRRSVQLLEMVDRPETLGFQADMAHTLLYLLGENAPEDRMVGEDFDFSNQEAYEAAYKEMTDILRPWTIDLHIAQNDATIHGSGTHDKTGRHCLPEDPNGKLDIPYHAGFWMRDASGEVNKKFPHICWDGCMFSNEIMMKDETWNSILAAMVAVRDQHGWQ
jgi:sugar phosphate isomerase/epimerase